MSSEQKMIQSRKGVRKYEGSPTSSENIMKLGSQTA